MQKQLASYCQWHHCFTMGVGSLAFIPEQILSFLCWTIVLWFLLSDAKQDVIYASMFSSMDLNYLPWYSFPIFFLQTFFLCGQFKKSLLNLIQYCFCLMFWLFGHEACRIIVLHRGWNLHPLYWKAKSQPLDHEGSLSHPFSFRSASQKPRWLLFIYLESIDHLHGKVNSRPIFRDHRIVEREVHGVVTLDSGQEIKWYWSFLLSLVRRMVSIFRVGLR